MTTLYTFLEILSNIDDAVEDFSDTGEMSPFSSTFSPELRTDLGTNIQINYFGAEYIDAANPTAEELAIGDVLGALKQYLDNSADLHGGTTDSGGITAFVDSQVNGSSGGWTYLVTDHGSAVVINPLAPTLFTMDWFRVTATDTGNNYVYEIDVWLTDARFRAECPVAHFAVVPPLDPIFPANDAALAFIEDFDLAKTEILNRTIDDNMTRAAEFLFGRVSTGMESLTLRIQETGNPTNTVDVQFLIGYNGGVGITFSNLTAAVLEYLNGLSGNYDVQDWVDIIPQLNSLGKYYIIPVWDHIAIPNPNPTLHPVMYNPLHWHHDASTTHLKPLYFNGVFPIAGDFNRVMNYGVSSYKSIGFYALPDPENEGGAFTALLDNYTDYIVMNINTLNSIGISTLTENMLRDLHMTIQQAEIYEVNDVLPNGYSLEVWNGRRYISIANPFGRAKMLVCTRENYVSLNPF